VADTDCDGMSLGVIAEKGTHDELFAQNGLYADLIRLQMDSVGEEVTEQEIEAAEEADLERELAEAAALIDDEIVTAAGDIEQGSAERARARTHSSDLKVASGEATAAVVSKNSVQKEGELEADVKSTVTRRIWSYIFKFPVLFALGLIGAILFGAVFPCWGLLLARTQEMFYYTDPAQIRSHARLYAGLYIVLGAVAFTSSLAQYYGIVGVRIDLLSDS
jgi:hypothetical protein